MGAQYRVLRLVGVPVVQTANGQYAIKRDHNQHFKLHEWRIGKHTKGHYQGPGQLFLTEQQMRVAIVAAFDVSFKKRHRYQPMARFLTDCAPAEVIAEAQAQGAQQHLI
ncbi:hypothetical protein M3M35_05475 [Fructilactobacillus myrtifloralis]|uniref:DUF7671 domain-containing protein n=1 Tax=Fructilactobacillus myrtifloralis TaxID=2940301 RepID=A0ABY5BNS7_9LACO|nr:hypothetical protein [Fructilactobacillus myrtifloralis]USS84757.1 hypothetical protein M3M35_05475 [Fructilactobacillus myrtifloralis]